MTTTTNQRPGRHPRLDAFLEAMAWAGTLWDPGRGVAAEMWRRARDEQRLRDWMHEEAPDGHR